MDSDKKVVAKKSSNAAKIYTRIRTGKLFLIILCTFCSIWMSWNTFLPVYLQFDPVSSGFPLLTLMLSIEASVAASVIIMAGQESVIKQENQLKYLLHQSEAMLEILEKLALSKNLEED